MLTTYFIFCMQLTNQNEKYKNRHTNNSQSLTAPNVTSLQYTLYWITLSMQSKQSNTIQCKTNSYQAVVMQIQRQREGSYERWVEVSSQMFLKRQLTIYI